jgi:hypothetical protein
VTLWAKSKKKKEYKSGGDAGRLDYIKFLFALKKERLGHRGAAKLQA